MLTIDYSSITDFSRDRCVAICSFLVPANLLLTIQTLVLIARDRAQILIQSSVAIATVLAVILVLHVGTWFSIGVITPVTFILLTLASTCLTLNFWAIANQSTFRRLLRMGYQFVRPILKIGV
jgi:hypothetical protein